jgi:addiction module HigA family antidote
MKHVSTSHKSRTDIKRLKSMKDSEILIDKEAPAWTPEMFARAIVRKGHNPPHPGRIIKTLCLDPLGLTVTEAAKGLGVSRKTLSGILNGRAGISPEMAVRLSIAFDTSAESWINQQAQYDLWHAEQGRKQLRMLRLAA